MSLESDLANFVEEVPERYVPGLMRGQLVEAEHHGRYQWAAQLAGGRRVLDAGCGLAYGCRMLLEAGAAEVVGVDSAVAVLDVAREHMPDRVRLEVGDVRALPFPAASFDLVVCFEVIEHVDEPEAVLDELTRVLTADGCLVVSSPNRDVYPAGNPHHLHELTRAELSRALNRRFAHTELVRQHSWNATAIGRRRPIGDRPAAVEPVRVFTTVEAPEGEESYSVAIASQRELPELMDVVVLARDLEFRQWLEHFDAQQRYIGELEQRIQQLGAHTAERAELRRRLLEAEQQLAQLPELREGIVERELAIRNLGDEIAELEHLRGVLAAVRRSTSWRLTAPLRRARRFLRPR